ncbi:MAG TPA: acetate/propionate family kinase [Xanthomonadaceae bacterium]|nr:acetate/propionate family kinase [Xanthomonadaceae bacterium]
MSNTQVVPVLALNAGSSSLKFGLYLVNADATRVLVSGSCETNGDHGGAIIVRDALGHTLDGDAKPVGALHGAVDRIFELLAARYLTAPVAIGHRIVHGGPDCRQHTLIDASVLQRLQAAKIFAPLHVPPALEMIRCAQERFPGVPQAACLDTAFHAAMPDVARTLPLPRELRMQGIERYGFHGLSCESIVRALGKDLPQRLVIAHLGHGASVTAIANGRSIDTSMGLTPSGGVIMSTRCGDIDPGVLEHLVRELGYDAAQLEALIDQQSGMYGISSLSGDMRELHGAAVSNEDARLAIAMFAYSVRKQIASMAAALGGVDLLVFTGGIGENDPATRALICEGLDGLAIRVDSGGVRVMPSQEDEQIARHAWRLVTAAR